MARSHSRKKAEEALAEPEDLAEKLDRQSEKLKDALLVRRSAELTDFVALLGSKRRLASVNFLIGLARGVGLFLGFSLLGAVLVAIVAFAVDWTASTFESSYTTRSMVRSLMAKYSDVIEEVELARIEGTLGNRPAVSMPAATGAQVGAVLLLED
jgi:hypothetical protein